MLRRCITCGVDFEGTHDQVKCPACVLAQRRQTLRPRQCCACGRSFPGGPAARYCPDCRHERKRAAELRYHRDGPARPLGSVDLCVVCGKKYIVDSGQQKYCPDCKADEYRKVDAAGARRWIETHDFTETRRQRREQAMAEIPCTVCGKMFTPRYGANVCSPECRKAADKKSNQQFEATHKEERNAYRRDLRKKKRNEMTPEELAKYREEINRRARENYAKRKAKKVAENS